MPRDTVFSKSKAYRIFTGTSARTERRRAAPDSTMAIIGKDEYARPAVSPSLNKIRFHSKTNLDAVCSRLDKLEHDVREIMKRCEQCV